MSSVTDFRVALMAHLKTATGGIEFVGGPVETAQENRDLGCVWMESKRPFGGDGNIEQVLYGVRLIRMWKEDQGPNTTGRNIAQLEADVEVLQAAFRQVLTTMGHDFFNVTGVAINYELQFVEAGLTAFQPNLGSRGG